MATIGNDPIWNEFPNRSGASGKRIPEAKRLQARALGQNGMSTRKIAAIVGIAPSSVHSIMQDTDLNEDVINHMKNGIAGRFYKTSHLALNEITPERLKFMNPYQNVLIAKIGLDAARMAEGLPTQIIQTRSLAVRLSADVGQLQRKKEKLLRSLGGSVDDLHDGQAGEKVQRVYK